MPTSSIVDEYDAHFEPYRWAVYINTALSIPLNILAVYLIWYKSPKHLGKYKYVLLNISLWVFLADLVDEVIFLPLPLMEVFAFSTSGLASALGPNGGFACLVACICCVAESLASLLLAFIYRCSALKGGFDIFGKRLEHRHYWIGSFVLMTVPAGSMMAGTVICYVSQDEFRERVLKVRPDFKPFFDSFPLNDVKNVWNLRNAHIILVQVPFKITNVLYDGGQ
ncbi:hypothetical protein QR680_015881 [Steinernema hermaphroditum]|uniref:Uncharacterized protein n=1 Tax=Steinernema hermaphroditum TaxID=289476 RepID=A0AA39HA89_9BILA|nr:hypothetical protein QR680_015881 [Steinernema hermaphroditum]